MIFVDAGAFVARYVQKDQHHRVALDHWKLIEASGERVYTSNAVLVEAFTLIGRRAGCRFAAVRARTIYGSARFTILRTTEAEETKAIIYLDQYAHLQIGFTDCISFVLMEREGIRDVFTFDDHFRHAGFNVQP